MSTTGNDPSNDVGRAEGHTTGPIPGYAGDLVQLCRREGEDCRATSQDPWLQAHPQEWTQIAEAVDVATYEQLRRSLLDVQLAARVVGMHASLRHGTAI